MLLPFRPSRISSSPFPTLGEPLSIYPRRLSAPSSFFVPLRGYLFAFSFSPFAEIFCPLPDPWRTPLDLPPMPSCPFAVLRAPSWISFCLFALRGNLLPPTRPLADPYRSTPDALVPLRRSSCPFVDMFLPFPFRPSRISPSPFPTLGEPLSIYPRRLSAPSPFFVALRGYVFAFSFSPLVDKSFYPVAVLRGRALCGRDARAPGGHRLMTALFV